MFITILIQSAMDWKKIHSSKLSQWVFYMLREISFLNVFANFSTNFFFTYKFLRDCGTLGVQTSCSNENKSNILFIYFWFKLTKDGSFTGVLFWKSKIFNTFIQNLSMFKSQKQFIRIRVHLIISDNISPT